MREIKCPNCHTVFSLDESDYYNIVKQVRDKEFEKEVEHFRKDLQAREEVLNQKKELEALRFEQRLEKELARKEREIQELKNQKEMLKVQDELKMEKVIASMEQEKESLRRSKEELIEKYNWELKTKDEMIAYYKDLKLKMSTKMIGETLEKHCENQFNQLRATGFQNAYFEKDNDASTGSKGDYIFKELDEQGNELISIMFEMKNEADQTATKKTNESFLKELDKDRNEKHCEYAVLVSLLEPESELYNMGIVDMSHRYPKMFVIRPQFFIPLITILRNAALKNAEIKKELIQMREQNIDITHFEEKMTDFKDGFSKNVDLASRKFQSAIDEIDKTISHLQKIKENLLSSDRQLHIANKKVDSLSIRSLTYNNPTMQKMFKELDKK